jgi:polyphosphate kinase
MIDKLYEASRAGVRIRLIIRGICCLIPGVKGMSENIKVISIVGRYLEHSRLYVFHHGGARKLYFSSADWMRRNLTHRIEVAVPVYDTKIRKELFNIIKLQLSDNVKARKINRKQTNPYRLVRSAQQTNAQYSIYQYFEQLSTPSNSNQTASAR